MGTTQKMFANTTSSAAAAVQRVVDHGRRRRIQRTRSTTNNNNKTVVRAAAGKTTPSVETTTTTAVDVAERPMKIVFVSTECAPYSKTGGLGDVVGSLPIELAKRGHKVMSITPRYDQYEGAWDTSVSTTALGEKVGFFHEKKKGVDRVFVDHPLFLAKVWGKTGDKLYGKASGADYADNAKRFALFAKAVLDAPTMLPLEYGEDVVFVCNDWHSSLVPVLLKHECKPNGKFVDAKSIMCVHNIAFQGRFCRNRWKSWAFQPPRRMTSSSKTATRRFTTR